MTHPAMHRLWIWIGLILCLSGCADIPFTQSMRMENNLSAEELKRLQYYVSEKIVLQREVYSDESEVVDGKLIRKKGEYIDVVQVKPHTPGIAVDVEDDRLGISFQAGTKLDFKANPALDGKYSLRASSKTGRVRFDGKVYRATGKSGGAFLLIDKESLEKVEKKKRVLEGIRLEEAPGAE